MVTPTVKIKGLRELQRKFQQMVKEMQSDPMLQAIARATLLVQRDAKKNAPVDTGRLRASIVPDIVTRDTVVQGLVGSNVEYAPYQEFGTRRGVPAVRYLQRALNDNARRIFKLLGNAVAGVIKRGGD